MAAPRRASRTTRHRRWGAWQWTAYVVTLVFVGVLATQLYYFVQIGWWVRFDPSSTAFMRAAAARLHETDPTATLKHQWVPYDQISRHLKRAIIASEDANFVNHDGFEIDAMLGAWEKNQKKGRIVAGGSTLSQQLAKNLFLSSERSYLRKAEELSITWMLEFWTTKQRIFAIYRNSVEWGEGVFGAEATARHYYGIPASKLSAWQAARLAVMLPRPRYFDAHRNSPYLAQRAGVIARRMGAAELPQ